MFKLDTVHTHTNLFTAEVHWNPSTFHSQLLFKLELCEPNLCLLCVNKSSNLNVVINVRMLSRNVIGWLLVAACFKRDRDASADWLPAEAVGGSTRVVIGPFSESVLVHSSNWLSPLSLHLSIQLYNFLYPSIHPTNIHLSPSSHLLNSQLYHPSNVKLYLSNTSLSSSMNSSIQLSTVPHPPFIQLTFSFVHPFNFYLCPSVHPCSSWLYHHPKNFHPHLSIFLSIHSTFILHILATIHAFVHQ